MKKINKIPTVTVAISAFNEEQNIIPFLKSVLKQKQHRYLLKNIWVFNDGSSDNTYKRALSIKDPRIKVFNDSIRIGKSSRLNQIYKSLKSDFLVQSDADVVFSNPNVIINVIGPMLSDKKVGMAGGNPFPVKGKTFVEKAVNCTTLAYYPLKTTYKGGNNIFSVDGRLLAYKKHFISKVKVPADTIANDAYTYFCCIKKGFKYKFVESAKVYFRSPNTLNDQLRQNTRFVAAPIRMSKLFSKKFAEKEYFVPKSYLGLLMFKQFIKHPIMCAFIFLINRYCQLKALQKESTFTALWPMAVTTKALNNL
jgi:cellulose synthase/poly-beta-1,6-N-acetylglucosamine synthase-like glycosyltransferase